MFSRSDLKIVADALAEAARVEIMPRFRNLTAGAVRTKTSAVDLVTDADESAERHIIANLSKTFPNAVFVGEESTEKDKSLLGAIADADLAIIIDPVDGTANFASGLPLFGVMAAVAIKGETVGAAIYDPLVEDWALALKGEGAWFEEMDGSTRDLRVADAVPVSDMIGCTSWNNAPEPTRSTLAANQARFRGSYVFRNAAHEYRLTASGHLHYLMFHKLMPWDHAPGALIVEEAGGFVRCFDGSLYTAAIHEGGILVAVDEDSWYAAREALLDMPRG